jgi:hypothetical protein
MTPLESVSSKSGVVLFLSLVIIAWTLLRESDVAHAIHMSARICQLAGTGGAPTATAEESSRSRAEETWTAQQLRSGLG